MTKKQWILLSIPLLFILYLFINGWYLDNKGIEEKVEGILLSKRPTGRGTFTIILYNSTANSNTKHNYTHFNIFGKLIIGDSLFKNYNSKFLKVFRKENDNYHFIDSFKISRW